MSTEIKNLLKEAHDLMDDSNADLEYTDFVCQWCHALGWDAHGVIHSDDCILVRMRAIEGIG